MAEAENARLVYPAVGKTRSRKMPALQARTKSMKMPELRQKAKALCKKPVVSFPVVLLSASFMLTKRRDCYALPSRL